MQMFKRNSENHGNETTNRTWKQWKENKQNNQRFKEETQKLWNPPKAPKFLSRMGVTLRPKSKSQSLMLVGCQVGCFTQFRVAGPASGLGHQKLEEPASWVPFCDGAQHTEDFCLFNSTASSPSPCRWELMRFKERLLQFLQREPGVGHDRCPYVEAHCIWLSL